MEKRKTAFKATIVAVLIFFTALSGEIRMRSLDVSPYIGTYFYQENLYIDLNHGMNMGLRLGYNITEEWAVETTSGYVATTTMHDYRTPGGRTLYKGTHVDFWLFHLDAVYHLFPDELVNPYISFGGGAYNIDPQTFDSNIDPLFNYGFGVKYSLSDWAAFRADCRHIMSVNQTDAFDRASEDLHHNLTFDVGMTFSIGGIRPDTDGDGVYDRKDKCPNTPLGVEVDIDGCPVDTDGDGVPDYLDKCPDTPQGVEVDEHGCPVDTDGDGVPDYLDKCPGTPQGVEVDEHGCPVDTDGDGVADYLDKCPDTPQGTEVDEYGCPYPDSDKDGVCDPWVNELGLSDLYSDICTGSDRCPDTPEGDEVDEHGCTYTRIVLEKDDKITLDNIYFELGKASLVPDSYPILDEAMKIFKDNPGIKIEIEGHTDSQGSAAYNKDLSQRRAETVMRYLVENLGVPQDQLTAVGYGEERPVADNRTKEGRARNRRIEFRVK
ncbi:MAG: outer membrane beta-barrel domain-containing protein [Candidatus Delongbacteria bacterium]